MCKVRVPVVQSSVHERYFPAVNFTQPAAENLTAFNAELGAAEGDAEDVCAGVAAALSAELSGACAGSCTPGC